VYNRLSREALSQLVNLHDYSDWCGFSGKLIPAHTPGVCVSQTDARSIEYSYGCDLAPLCVRLPFGGFAIFPIFTALHGMQMRSSDEKAVCLCNKRVDCDKTEERSVQIFIPYERSFSLVF